MAASKPNRLLMNVIIKKTFLIAFHRKYLKFAPSVLLLHPFVSLVKRKWRIVSRPHRVPAPIVLTRHPALPLVLSLPLLVLLVHPPVHKLLHRCHNRIFHRSILPHRKFYRLLMSILLHLHSPLHATCSNPSWPYTALVQRRAAAVRTPVSRTPSQYRRRARQVRTPVW